MTPGLALSSGEARLWVLHDHEPSLKSVPLLQIKSQEVVNLLQTFNLKTLLSEKANSKGNILTIRI